MHSDDKKELTIQIIFTIILMIVSFYFVGWSAIAIILGAICVCYIGWWGGAGHYDAAMETCCLGLEMGK